MSNDDHNKGKNISPGGKKKPSRLDKHNKILGIDVTNDVISERELTAERAMIDSMELPPLDFGSVEADDSNVSSIHSKKKSGWKKRVLYPSLVGFAVAATLAVMVLQPDEAPQPYAIKGTSPVNVYAMIDGKTTLHQKEDVLPEGAKIMVDVAATINGVAFVLVSDNQGNQLLPEDDVFRDRLILKIGQKSKTKGSLELTGASEGETLLVAVCGSALNDPSMFSAQVWGPLSEGQEISSVCALTEIGLR